MAKIKYGLSNVYYAIGTQGDNNTMTYSTPVAIKGAVSLSMSAEGENTDFYADNITYWTGNGNNGYSGTLEIARIPEDFKEDVLGMVEDSSDVLVETMNSAIVHFALMFQFESDVNATRHIFYNCTCSRPDVAGETKGENIEPQTETLNISAKSIYNASLNAEIVKADCPYSSSAYETWNTTVHVPALTAATT